MADDRKKTTTVQGATVQTAGCQQHFTAQSYTKTAWNKEPEGHTKRRLHIVN